jgi:hypothetical protein
MLVLTRILPGIAFWLDLVLDVRKEDLSGLKSVKSLRRSVLFSAALGGDEPQPPSTTKGHVIEDMTCFCKHLHVCLASMPVCINYASNALQPTNQSLLMPISAELTGCTYVHASWLMSMMKTSEHITTPSEAAKCSLLHLVKPLIDSSIPSADIN